jgi:hypothetical protein
MSFIDILTARSLRDRIAAEKALRERCSEMPICGELVSQFLDDCANTRPQGLEPDEKGNDFFTERPIDW